MLVTIGTGLILAPKDSLDVFHLAMIPGSTENVACVKSLI